MTTNKKRNPNDATMRNITALKKRVAKLEANSDKPSEKQLKKFLAQLRKDVTAQIKKSK